MGFRPVVARLVVACCLAPMPLSAGGREAEAIPVCLAGDLNFTNHLIIGQGEAVASQLFRRIGIGVAWHNAPSACPEEREPVLVRVWTHTPSDYHRGASGVSRPYDGVHVEIFYDRMESAVADSMLTGLVGHVLAHEIAHVLGGTEAHSSGVMQAYFSREDIRRMTLVPLRFPEAYIIVLRDGLRTRHERLAGVRGKSLVNSLAAEVSAAPNGCCSSRLKGTEKSKNHFGRR